MLGNPDIWREVLDHFELEPFPAIDKELIIKRKTILSVSLLSSDFVELGLNALWKRMRSLQPIVKILNSKASPPDRIIEHQKSSYTGATWMLRQPIEQDIINRAKEYLSRVQYFTLTNEWLGTLSGEIALGLVLSGTLANANGPCATLLPNLRNLEIVIPRPTSTSHLESHLIHIHPIFVSPVLENIVYHDSSPPHNLPIVVTLQHLLKSWPPSLTSIAYHGQPWTPTHLLTTELIRGLSCLERLKRLDMSFSAPPTSPSSYSVQYLFSRLPNLQFLSFDIDLFTRATSPPDVIVPTIARLPLQELHLKGVDSNIYESISRDFTVSNLLTKLSFSFRKPGTSTIAWRVLLDKASSIFPSTKSLSLQCTTRNTSQLIFGDLSSYLTHNHFTSFTLTSVPYSLSFEDVANAIKSWPDLQTFEIFYEQNSKPFPPEILANFSSLSYLQRLVLPLDFTNLPSVPLVTNPAQNSKNNISPLRTLTISSSPNWHVVSPPLRAKINFANQLLFLFPSLCWIKPDLAGCQLGVPDDLQDLITAFRTHYEQGVESHLKRREWYIVDNGTDQEQYLKGHPHDQ